MIVLAALFALELSTPLVPAIQQGGTRPESFCQDAPYRQFDFWIGEWEVRPTQSPASEPTARTNVIEKAHGGCVLIEDWKTPDMTGQSLNIYDRTSGRWRQVWTDSYGQLNEYWGLLEDGNMVFLGSMPVRGAPTQRQTVRMTFFPLGPDRVRQLSEVQRADGSWAENYDLTYYRRQPASAR